MNDAQVEEIKRHFRVVTEALRSDSRQVAEGHSGIRREVQEMRDEFREMRALMRLSFSQLDERIRTLETDMLTLKARMDRFEAHRAWLFSPCIFSGDVYPEFSKQCSRTDLPHSLFLTSPVLIARSTIKTHPH